jgi:hypothetical protein
MLQRALPFFLVLAGCSEVVIDRNEGTGGAGGATPSSSSSSKVIAATGTGTEAATTSTGFEPTGGQGGAFPNCELAPGEEPYGVELVVGNSEPVLYGGCLPEQQQPSARVMGGECGESTIIRACLGGLPPDSVFVFDATTSLVDVGQGIMWGSTESHVFTDLQVTIESFGDVGEPVVGTYEGMTMNGEDPTLPISGRFKLCRAPDYPPCP